MVTMKVLFWGESSYGVRIIWLLLSSSLVYIVLTKRDGINDWGFEKI